MGGEGALGEGEGGGGGCVEGGEEGLGVLEGGLGVWWEEGV